MTERERLVELLRKAQNQGNLPYYDLYDLEHDTGCAEELACYLLANGVIVLPCKVGDTVYRVVSMGTGVTLKRVKHSNVYRKAPQTIKHFIRIVKVSKNNFFDICENFDITVFHTKEEAEKALKERSEK